MNCQNIRNFMSLERRIVLGVQTQNIKQGAGFLGRPCPVCGYKYGSAWQTEEVPKDVIEWLFDLPDTKIKPAWV